MKKILLIIFALIIIALVSLGTYLLLLNSPTFNNYFVDDSSVSLGNTFENKTEDEHLKDVQEVIQPIKYFAITSCDDESNEDRSVPRECRFQTGEHYFIAQITMDGVSILNSDKSFLTKVSLGQGKGDENMYGWIAENHSTNRIIQLQDSTFDGYDDLLLMGNSGAYNFEQQIVPFDPATKTFKSEATLSLTNASFNAPDRTVSEFVKGRGVGDIYTMNKYAYIDGEFILIMSESQDIEGDYFSEAQSEYYRRIRKELIDGQLVEVSNELIPRSEIFPEGY